MEYKNLCKTVDKNEPSVLNQNVLVSSELKLFSYQYNLLGLMKNDFDLIYFGSSPGIHLNALFKFLKRNPIIKIFVDEKKTMQEIDDNIIIISKKIKPENLKKYVKNHIVIIIENNYDISLSELKKIFNPVMIIKNYDSIKKITHKINLTNLFLPPFIDYESLEVIYVYIKGVQEKDEIDNNAEEKITYYNRFLRNDFDMFSEIVKDVSLYEILYLFIKTENDYINNKNF